MGELVECSCDKNLVRHNVLLNNNQMTTFDNTKNGNNSNNSKNRTKKPRRNGGNKKSRNANRKSQRRAPPTTLPIDGPSLPVIGENWEWSGCDDNVNFGNRKSKDFLDARFRRRSDIKTLVKIHNNDAGRLVSRPFVI